MFERYTEKARRVVFFARYEASQLGSACIESEHLLLGLLREDKPLADGVLKTAGSVESIQTEIEQRAKAGHKTAVSQDLPLSHECKRVLAYGAEESERLGDKEIGTLHLLLGLLREEKCMAARLLRDRGVELGALRSDAARSKAKIDATGSGPAAAASQTDALLNALLTRAGSGDVAVVASPTVGAASTVSFAIYADPLVVSDGEYLGRQPPEPLTPADELIDLQRRMRAANREMQRAIGQHRFEVAGLFSNEERELRQKLRACKAAHNLTAWPAMPVPALCIDFAGEESLRKSQDRCQEFLDAGAACVWILDFGSKRAYTVTAGEGLREVRDGRLELVRPVSLVLDTANLFGAGAS